jgi:hypothetical protein
MTTENYIRAAAERLPGRWTQSTMGRPGTPQCGLGHLLTVAGTGGIGLFQDPALEDVLYRQRDLMTRAAMDKFPDRIGEWDEVDPFARGVLDNCPFAHFNDHERTTEADVISVMTLAADRWDVEHG